MFRVLEKFHVLDHVVDVQAQEGMRVHRRGKKYEIVKHGTQ